MEIRMKDEITIEDLNGLKYYLIGHLDGKFKGIEEKIIKLSESLQDLNKDIERSRIEAKFNISETHLKIVNFLLKEYPKKYGAEEISEKIEISRAQVFNLLSDLFEASFVEKDRIGKNVVYKIDKARAISILGERIKGSKDDKTIAEESLRLARIHYAEGNYDEGVKFVEMAFNIFNSFKNEKKLAECHSILAKFDETIFKFDEAISHYASSLELYNKLKDRENQYLTTFSLGSIQYKIGNYDEALVLYEKNLEISMELQNQKEIAKTLSQIALINQIKGESEKALEFYNKSLEIKKNLEELDDVVRIQSKIAKIYHDKEEYDMALKFYNKSLEIERNFENQIGIASLLHQKAMIYQTKGEYAEALRYYNESLEIDRKLVNKIGIARTLYQKAMIHQTKGEYAEALGYYNESLEIDRKLVNKKGIARTLYQKAMIHQAKGEIEDASRNYNEAINIFEKFGDKRDIALTFHQIAMISQDKGKYADALKLHDESLEINQKHGNRTGIAFTLYQKAMICQTKGEIDDALKLYQEAKETFEEVGDKRNIANILHQIANIHQIKGEYLFCWNNIPGSDNIRLIQILKRQFHIDWAKSAEINKIEGDKVINVSTEKNFLSLRLNNERTRVSLTIDNGAEYEIIARMENNVLNIYGGGYEKALELLEESLNNRRTLGDQEGIASTLVEMASLNRQEEKFEVANENLKEAIPILRKIGNESDIKKVEDMMKNIASKLHQIAKNYQKRGENNTALKLYNGIKESYQKLEDQKNLATVLVEMASLNRQEEKFEVANENLKEAIPILRKIGNESDIKKVEDMMKNIASKLHQIAKNYQKRGENNTALKLYNRIKESYQKLEDQKNLATVLVEMASLNRQEKEYLFSWDGIPGNDSLRLIDFLKQKYDIDWITTAKIEKIDNGKTIKLSAEKNYLSLKLNDGKNEINLEIDDVRANKFIVRTEKGKLNIYEKKFEAANENLKEAIPILRKIGNESDIKKAVDMLQNITNELHQTAKNYQNMGENNTALKLYNGIKGSYQKLEDQKAWQQS